MVEKGLPVRETGKITNYGLRMKNNNIESKLNIQPDIKLSSC